MGRDRHQLDWQEDRKKLTLINERQNDRKEEFEEGRRELRQKNIDLDRCRIE